jgi:hypothetical protein
VLRKALLVLGVLVAWRALVAAGSGGHVLEVLFAWSLFAYLLFRAWPAVREDFRRLRAGGFGRLFSWRGPGARRDDGGF